jgi:Gluconate 2-dehydrogenase subunit 3
MAYDRRQEGEHQVAAVSRPDFRVELGPVYVPVGDSRGFALLEPEPAATLRAWVDQLIPARGQRPAAGEVGAAEYVDASVFRAPRLRPALLDGIERLEAWARRHRGTAFPHLDPADQAAALRDLETAEPDLFGMVLALTYEAYYAHPRVLEVLERETGWRGFTPTTGSPMEPFDTRLLDRVRQLPPRYLQPSDDRRP